MKAVLLFRTEKACTFGGMFYKATDECEPQEQSHWEFPGSMALDIPQHFTAVLSANDDVDKETQDLRDAYFAQAIPASRTTSSEGDRLAEVERIKSGFLEAPSDGSKANSSDPSDMSKKQLFEALKLAGLEFKPTDSVAELSARLTAYRAGA